MPTITRLCLVRHGETDWNVEKRLQGHMDIPLNATGQKQAQCTAANLAHQPITAIYSSDLERAMSTAQAAATHLQLPVQAMTELRERHCGIFQGLTQDEARARYGADYDRYRGRDPHFAIPGGETLLQVAERVKTCLTRLCQAHPDETILVVSHGGVLDIAHRLATAKPLETPRDFLISNAALNWIEYRSNSWHLIAWDEKPHLAAAMDELPG